MPIDFRLTDAVPEPEWFVVVEVRGRETTHDVERVLPQADAGHAFHEAAEQLRFGKEHHQEMRHVSQITAPCPV